MNEYNSRSQNSLKFNGVDARMTWGFISGYSSPNSLKGVYSDWVFAKGADENALSDAPTQITSINVARSFLEFGAFATNPTWVYVPIIEAGYRGFVVDVSGSLNQTILVSAYSVPEIPKPLPDGFADSFLLTQMVAANLIIKDVALPVATGSQVAFGPGGSDLSVDTVCPAGGIIIKLARNATTAPTTGAARLYIARSK